MGTREDLKKYPCFVFRNKKLIPITAPENWDNGYQIHHFVRQAIRKNSPEFYRRVEHLQKLILMPAQVNYDLETMGEDTFWIHYGVDKNRLVFSRKKWREGFYD